MMEIRIGIRFEPDDAGRAVRDGPRSRSFIGRFAAKLAKMNGERIYVNRFLPQSLRFRAIVASVKPLEGHETWKEPRRFVFTDTSNAVDFCAAFPELIEEPAQESLAVVLEHIRAWEIAEADEVLRSIEAISDDLTIPLRSKVSYERACVRSIEAEEETSEPAKSAFLDDSVAALRRWIELGVDGGWLAIGETPNNALYKLGTDTDFLCVLTERQVEIRASIPERFRSALPEDLPQRHWGGSERGGSGFGCVPTGALLVGPSGPVPVEDIRIGSSIRSTRIDPVEPITVRVVQTFCSREPELIKLNGHAVFTPSQPVFSVGGTLVRAEELRIGSVILDAEGAPYSIKTIERVRGYAFVHTLTTDDASHNFLASGILCANKKPVFPSDFV
jgi:hypothetical protein